MISFVKKFLKMCCEAFCRPCFQVQQIGLFVTLMVSKPERTYMSYLSCQYLAKLAIELELL